MIDVKIIADSVSNDVRLTTFQICMHRYMLPEITRHRMLSFSVASNRAIPTKKILDRVEENPATPIYWGANQPGMVADKENDENVSLTFGSVSKENAWKFAVKDAVYAARAFSESGYHKQISNRLVEPFQWCDLIVSGTEWDNFFNLRLADEAQPEIREVARSMKAAMDLNAPKPIKPGQWHLPYIYESNSVDDLRMISAARCARVSYLNHDKTNPDTDADLNLAERLYKSGHWSPFEHQATPVDFSNVECFVWDIPGITHITKDEDEWSGNFRKWSQLRHIL